MTIHVEAVYEGGALQPLGELHLKNGQKVSLSIEIPSANGVPTDPQLPDWCNVYEGLSEQDIAEVEAIILDRSNFTTFKDD